MNAFLAFPLLLGLAWGGTAPGPVPGKKLDMSNVQVNFREGELDVVKGLLESFLKNESGKASRDEKIFAYKYLGVIYAVDPATRAKSESYFNLLLPLAPNIELADMYVSRDIQALFDDVKREYLHTQEYSSNFDAFGNPKAREKTAVAPKSEPAKPVAASSQPKKTAAASESGDRKWIWWTAGLTAAAVGTGVVIWVAQSDSPTETHFDGTMR